MSLATDRQVADWLVALGRLTTFNGSAEDAASSIRAYVPELVKRYDTRDFDGSSREWVARHSKFFPSYGELCELLDKWPKPSARPALPSPTNNDLDAIDRSWLEFYRKRRAEIYAQQDGFGWKTREADLANLASLVRGQSPKAWYEINGSEPSRHVPTEREIAAVAEALQKFRHKTPKPAMPDAPSIGQTRPDVTLKGETLHRSRVARGCNVPVPGYEPPAPVVDAAAEELEPDPYADSPADAWS